MPSAVALGVLLYTAAATAAVSHWTVEGTPSPTPPSLNFSELQAVSCASARTCVAVGDVNCNGSRRVKARGCHHGSQLALADRWNGRRWTILHTPEPPGTTWSQFNDVSCASARACFAVGYYQRNDGPAVTLIERWNGRKWRIQHAPRPARHRTSELMAVSCSSSGACVALGQSGCPGTQCGPNVGPTLIERWNGRRWTILPAPKGGGYLSDISCASAGVCIAVGLSGSSGYNAAQTILAERWNGKRWRIQPTPNPRTAPSFYKYSQVDELSSVSCSSPNACVAVGAYDPTLSTLDPLVERWNGRKWMIQPTPNPRNRGGMDDVSCASANACTAIGVTNSGGTRVDAERWNGRRWTNQRIRPGTSDSGPQLNDVSCPTRSTCTAVGDYDLRFATQATLAERWNR